VKALKVIWGLLVDDAGLAIGTLVSLAVLAVFSFVVHATALAGWIFLAFLLLSLTVSLRRELHKRVNK